MFRCIICGMDDPPPGHRSKTCPERRESSLPTPKVVKKPAEPKSEPRAWARESGVRVCALCGDPGHNRQTCVLNEDPKPCKRCGRDLRDPINTTPDHSKGRTTYRCRACWLESKYQCLRRAADRKAGRPVQAHYTRLR